MEVSRVDHEEDTVEEKLTCPHGEERHETGYAAC